MMSESSCQLCSKEEDVDFITRCGHKFHDKCFQAEFGLSYEINCPKCTTELSKYKSIEEILFKARESLKHDELLTFFKQLSEYSFDGTIIAFNKNLLETAICYGYELSLSSPYFMALLKNISCNDLVHKFNILLELGFKLESIGDKNNILLWNLVFKNSAFNVIKRFKELGFYPKTISGSIKLSLRMINWLIENEFEVNPGSSCSKSIIIACKDRNISALKRLLESGVSIDVKDFFGRSLFHRIVYLTIDNDKSDNAPLFTNDIFKEHLGILQFLLDSGADIETVDNEGATPLFTALMKNNFELIYFLLSKGATLNTPKIKELGPRSHALLKACKNKVINEIFDKILEFAVDINEKDAEGQTCLHKAMGKQYDLAVVRCLLKRGADINSRDLNGNTPLHCFSLKKSSQRKKIKLLLGKGADIYAKNNEGKLALIYLIK